MQCVAGETGEKECQGFTWFSWLVLKLNENSVVKCTCYFMIHSSMHIIHASIEASIPTVSGSNLKRKRFIEGKRTRHWETVDRWFFVWLQPLTHILEWFQEDSIAAGIASASSPLISPREDSILLGFGQTDRLGFLLRSSILYPRTL